MLKNMKIGKILISAFIIVALIASISGITSIFVIKNVDTQYSKALVDYGFAQGDIGKAIILLQKSNANVRDIIAFTDQSVIDRAKQEMAAQAKEYNEVILPNVEKTLIGDQEKQIFSTLQTNYNAYITKRNEVLALGETTDAIKSAEAQKIMVNEMDPIYNELYNSYMALMDSNITTGNALSIDLTAQSNGSIIIDIVVIVVALSAAILIGLFVSRGITKPLQEVENAAKKMAEGHLEVDIDYESKNELGSLANSFRTIIMGLSKIITDIGYLLDEMGNGNFQVKSKVVDSYIEDYLPILTSIRSINSNLNDTLTQINQSADQVSSGSEQVSTGSQALSQGATEQASSIQELSATISEISTQVNKNAENAKVANDISSETSIEIGVGQEHMQEMIAAMDDISEKSNQISNIIKTIDNIAFQTNILALNAAVEAARAGEAGKGFAVVADEVRNLAGKSAEAAKNTTGLIGSSIEAVEKGTKIADQTAKSLDIIVVKAKEVSDKVNEIALASEEQAKSINQVTIGVDQISAVVQTNSATAEESAASSEELSGQAQILKGLVSKFKLKDTDKSKQNQFKSETPTFIDNSTNYSSGKY